MRRLIASSGYPSILFLLIFCTISHVCEAQFTQKTKPLIYEHPDLAQIIKTHKNVAILPFQVTVMLRPNEMKNMNYDQFEELQKAYGVQVQRALHDWIVERSEKDGMVVTLKSIEETNEILLKEIEDFNNIGKYTIDDLCRLLNVDAIIAGTFETSKPNSDLMAYFKFSITGFNTTVTDYSRFVFNILEAKQNELIYKYDKTLTQGFGGDTNKMIKVLMRKSSKRFPYLQRG